MDSLNALQHLPLDRIKTHSESVAPGDLFVALPGVGSHGATYIARAIARGAHYILSDQPPLTPNLATTCVLGWPGEPLSPSTATNPLSGAGEGSQRFHRTGPENASCGDAQYQWIQVPDVRQTFVKLVHDASHHIATQMPLIGITGTNGKSTVAHGAAQLLNAFGYRTGLFGTVEHRFASRVWPSTHTTPDLITLLTILQSMHDEGAKGAVLEVSSHALHQDRLAGCRFVGAVFTNLTQDHLDYHHSLDAYFEVKSRLFTPTWLNEDGFSVVNLDDAFGKRLVGAHPRHTISYALHDSAATLYANTYHCTAAGLTATITYHGTSYPFQSPLIGAHNLSNLLAMAGIGLGMGISFSDSLAYLSTYPGLRGRLERASRPSDPFSIFVDYAHTPDALHQVLKSLRPLVSSGAKLWVVFGCGGDRDRTKRPLMAEEAIAWADRVCITSDNPRTESPEAIIADMIAPLSKALMKEKVHIDPDRRRAIETCVTALGPGDILLVAGKGHEDYQLIGREKIHFDDVEVVRTCLP